LGLRGAGGGAILTAHDLRPASAPHVAHPWRPPRRSATRPVMTDIAVFRPAGEETLWAVVASVGRVSRVADIYHSRAAALADRNWRAQQVSAYAGFLSSARQPAPHYSVAPIRRADLPRKWTPLPALGFLRGQFV
jgi:hypothetical protein